MSMTILILIAMTMRMIFLQMRMSLLMGLMTSESDELDLSSRITEIGDEESPPPETKPKAAEKKLQENVLQKMQRL